VLGGGSHFKGRSGNSVLHKSTVPLLRKVHFRTAGLCVLVIFSGRLPVLGSKTIFTIHVNLSTTRVFTSLVTDKSTDLCMFEGHIVPNLYVLGASCPKFECSRTWVSNPPPAWFFCVAHARICKLCMHICMCVCIRSFTHSSIHLSIQ
jgi:hypothetical protein